MMLYNILSVIKRFHDYETIGELFRASHKDAVIGNFEPSKNGKVKPAVLIQK